MNSDIIHTGFTLKELHQIRYPCLVLPLKPHVETPWFGYTEGCWSCQYMPQTGSNTSWMTTMQFKPYLTRWIRGKRRTKNLQFLPYGRSIGSWICLTHKTYTCHTVQNAIRHIRFTGMKVRYTILDGVTMYNNAKRTLRKLQRFISTVILL
jgi:hypothetical protein